MTARNPDRRPVFGRWVRATWAGWVLGLPLVIALVLVGEAAGIGNSQGFLGVGMGAGIGLMQRRVIRDVLDRSAPWFWSCIVGLALPFLAVDVAKVAGFDVPYSLYACVALGGLVVGVWQALLLRQFYRHSAWWVVASAIGWTLGSAMAAVAGMLPRSPPFRGVPGAAAYLAIVAAGGLVLGGCTGAALTWLLRHGREGRRAWE